MQRSPASQPARQPAHSHAVGAAGGGEGGVKWVHCICTGEIPLHEHMSSWHHKAPISALASSTRLDFI